MPTADQNKLVRQIQTAIRNRKKTLQEQQSKSKHTLSNGHLKKTKKDYPFLHSGVWNTEKGSTDIAENHDHYLVPERKWSFLPISASNKNFNPCKYLMYNGGSPHKP